MPRPFTTVPTELVEVAEAAADHFEGQGYTVRVEPSEIGYPNRPTLTCRRGQTTIIAEVTAKPNVERSDAWLRYGRSTNRDVRAGIVIPSSTRSDTKTLRGLREKGLGIYSCHDGVLTEACAPRDLAVNVELPELRTLPFWVRQRMGPCYDQFSRTEWREGFESACVALEIECRRYLWSGLRRKRIQVLGGGGAPRSLTKDRVDRMSLGQLGVAYGNIDLPNQKDGQLATLLDKINDDRVAVAHHRRRAATEQSLRRNVGQHMWDIVGAMKLLEP
jgi:hypothetical protein